jgi:hypothetical protein
VFSDKYKEMVAAKERIGGIFDEMRQAYSLRRYFEFDFPTHFDNRNIRKISELTKDFDAALKMWRRRVPAVVREDVRRLNAKSIHPELDFREQIRDLETHWICFWMSSMPPTYTRMPSNTKCSRYPNGRSFWKT